MTAWMLSVAMVIGNGSVSVLAEEAQTEAMTEQYAVEASAEDYDTLEMPVETVPSEDMQIAEETVPEEAYPEEEIPEEEDISSEEPLFAEEDTWTGAEEIAPAQEQDENAETDSQEAAFTDDGWIDKDAAAEAAAVLAADEESGFNISFGDLRGGDHTWIFPDENLEIPLDLSSLSDIENVSVDIQAGRWNHEEGMLGDMIPEEEEGTYFSYDPDSGVITLYGAALAERFCEDNGGNWFHLEVLVTVGEDVAAQTVTYVEERPIVRDYWRPSFKAQLPDWNIGIDRYQECYVEDAEHPWGGSVGYEITDVELEVVAEDSDGEDAIVCEPYEDGNGWNIHMNRYGHGIVTMTYQLIDGQDETDTYSFDVWVSGSSYDMYLSSSTYASQLLPGASLELTAHPWMDCYEEERGHYQGDISNLWVEWNVTDEAYEDVLSYSADPEDLFTIHVAANPDGARRSVQFEARAFIPDGDDEDSEPDEVACADFWVHVQDGYYRLMPGDDEVKQDLAVGETTVWEPELQYFELGSEDTYRVITENVRYRWEWDSNAVEITDADGKVLTNNTEDGSGAVGTAPFTVKKLRNWGTDITLVAELVDEEGNGEEADRRSWNLQDVDYGTWFEEQRGGDHTWIFSEEDLTLNLNQENLSNKSGDPAVAEWTVGTQDENGNFTQILTNPMTEGADAYYEISGDTYSITLHGGALRTVYDPETENRWISVRAVVTAGEDEVSRADTNVEMVDSWYDYQWPANGPGEDQLFPGDRLDIPNGMEAFAVDKEHPWGENIQVEVTDVRILKQGEEWQEDELIDDGQERLRLEGDVQNGWSLEAGDRGGSALIEMTYRSAATQEEESHTFYLHICDQRYRLEYYYPDDSDCMLPGSGMEIHTRLFREWHDWEGNREEEEIEGYTLEVSDENGPCYDTNLLEVTTEQNDDGTVKLCISSGENTWDTNIHTRVMVDGQEVISYEIHVNVTDEYYNILPVSWEDTEVGNPNLGEELNLNELGLHLIRFHAENPDGEDVTDDPAYRIRMRRPEEGGYDSNAWTVREGSEDDLIPVLIRKGDWNTCVPLIAEWTSGESDEEGNLRWEEVTCRDYWFQELQYDVDIRSFYQDREMDRLYTDASLTVEFRDNGEGSHPLPEGCEIRWSVQEETEEGRMDCTYVTAQVSDEDPGVLELTAAGAVGEDRQIVVQAAVWYGDQEIGQASRECWIWVSDPVYDYHYPCQEAGENQLLYGREYTIGNELRYSLQNADYPDGTEDAVTVLDVRLGEQKRLDENEEWKDVPEEEPVCEIEERDGEWVIRAVGAGYAEVILTHESAKNREETEEYSFHMNSSDVVYVLNTYYPDDFDFLLVNGEIQIQTSLIRCYDDENGNYTEEEIADYELQVLTDEEGNPLYDTGLVDVEFVPGEESGKVVKVTSKGETGSTDIYIGAYLDGEYPMTIRRLHVNVEEGYTLIVPGQLTEENGETVNPYLNSLLDLSAFDIRVLERNLTENGPEERDRTSEVRFRLEYGPDDWEAVEETEEGTLPVLRRLNRWDTGFTVIAEADCAEEEGQEDWQEIARRDYWFPAALYYDAEEMDLFSELRGGDYVWLFTDETEVSVRLNSEQVMLPEGAAAEWRLGDYNEEGEFEVFAEEASGCFRVDEEQMGIVIDGTKILDALDGRYGCQLQVSFRLGEADLGGGEIWCEIREPECYLRFPKEKDMLLGDPGIRFSSDEPNLWVRNVCYPDGEDIYAPITSMVSTDEMVIRCEQAEDGTWTAEAVGEGYAEITVTVEHESIGKKPFTYPKTVRDEIYALLVYMKQGRGAMLPGQSLDMLPYVIRKTYSAEGELQAENVTAQYPASFSGYDEELITVDEGGTITAGDHTGDTCITVSISVPDKNGDFYPVERDVNIWVGSGFRTTLVDSNYPGERGDTIYVSDLDAKAVFYGEECPEGMELPDHVFRFCGASEYMTISEDGSSITISEDVPDGVHVLPVSLQTIEIVDGQEEIRCYSDVSFVLGDHVWDNGRVTKEATCIAEGEKRFRCVEPGCAAVKTEILPIDPDHHSPVTDPMKKATLTADGLTAGSHCELCQETLVKQNKIYRVSSITLSKTSYTYNGKVQKPSVKVVDSKGKTVSSSYYTVTYPSGCQNVGSYTVKVTLKGNYSGSKSLTYKITKANQTITASDKTTTLGAASFSLGAKTTSGGGKLSYASGNKAAATVSSSGKITVKGVGAATITIKAAATSNYNEATKKITVTVRPKGTTILGLANTVSRRLTVAWKQNTAVDGYQVQYGTSSGFSGAKLYTVFGKSKVLAYFSSLTKGKTYYVRVRTFKKVSGKYYYSSWSAAKKLKITK